MTNEQIIIDTAISLGIYDEEEIEEFLEKQGTLPLHTFAVWKTLGYVPKKGVHGYETRLWKRKTKKQDDTDKEKISEENRKDFYLTKAFLFDISQVEKIKEDKAC